MSSIRKYFFIIASVFIFMQSAGCTHVSKSVQTEQGEASWLKPGLLNSERIRMKFGSFGVDVLRQDPESYRLSSLYNLDQDQKVSRTVGMTVYTPNMNNELKIAHQEIIQGGSIGATLSKHGFKLIKTISFKGQISDMPQAMKNLMHTQENTYAALIYDLAGERDGEIYPYSTITEIYAPAFLTLRELDQLYPEEAAKKSKDAKVSEGLGTKNSKENVQAIIQMMRDLIEHSEK